MAVSISQHNAVIAGIVDIGGGWRASWAPSLDPFVSISTGVVIGDAVFIQKSAEFTQGPQGGVLPAIPIVFRQINAAAVSNIIIDDEIITNSTGVAWMGFHFEILDHGDALFDPVATANSGGSGPIGFTINPFTKSKFSANNMVLDVFDGIVEDGDV